MTQFPNFTCPKGNILSNPPFLSIDVYTIIGTNCCPQGMTHCTLSPVNTKDSRPPFWNIEPLYDMKGVVRFIRKFDWSKFGKNTPLERMPVAIFLCLLLCFRKHFQ